MNEHNYFERHLGTTVYLSFICEHKPLADRLAKEIFANIHKYEEIFSRFLPQSELSELNLQGERVMSDTFITVLKRSQELALLTNSVFNPLTQVAKLGYTETYSSLSNQLNTTDNTPYSSDIRLISIDTQTNRVSLAAKGRLDFGGVLKGYLANLLADEVMKSYPACTGNIINIGGDLATRGFDNVHRPFIFLLYNPLTGSELPVPITDSCLATSGTYARTWETNSGTKHHIVDAKSGQNSASDLISVSIITKDGALAEALCKLFLISGTKKAVDLLPPEKYDYQYFTVNSKGESDDNIT